ncbi:MAG TPA: Gfo/Idh/MocA family oxidoreductase [Tepidisphaeraceae bacterium]|jgi:predicted dehydrogenase|nr:Gfo/Idh/MocA family oxidoreductase [Tepidisphaeraceae bacterium]
MSKTREIRVGQIGVGKNGSAFTRAYKNIPPMNLVSICDVNESRARAVANEHGVERVYTDFREMLEREALDLVSLHTPDQLHVEPAVAALDLGKHLFCEKPLANDLEGCRRIVEAARRAAAKGVKAMCGHVLRFNPVFEEVKRRVDRGELGELFYLEGDYIHDLHWQKGWNLEDEVPMIGGGCHPIDIMQWWAGPIVEVQAMSNHIAFREMKQDDCAVAILKFASGAIGRCTSAYGPAGPMPKLYNLSAYGTGGTVVRDQFAPRGEETFSALPVSQVVGHPYEPEVVDLADAIVNDRAPRATVEDGARAIAVAVAIQEAIQTRAVVQVARI